VQVNHPAAQLCPVAAVVWPFASGSVVQRDAVLELCFLNVRIGIIRSRF